MVSGRAVVRELAAWGLDTSPYREAWTGVQGGCVQGAIDLAREVVSGREAWAGGAAPCEDGDAEMQELLARQSGRPDLLSEMRGLAWSLRVVDLRGLIAFQRRLVLRGAEDGSAELRAGASAECLVRLSFGPPRGVEYSVVEDKGPCEFELVSSNPDLQIRLRPGARGETAFEVYGGSPFFEVAEYRGRWFLRDGYHRAYACLCAGISHLPAVIVRARSLEELGATRPWFFGEDVLFCERPPMVTDFLSGETCLEYERPRLLKRVRVRVEESVVEERASGGNDRG